MAQTEIHHCALITHLSLPFTAASLTLPFCRDAAEAENARYVAKGFVKIFFIAKTSCTYTMNYLHQE
jgi:hypothetical protein